MNYQDADIAIKAATLGLTVANSIAVIVLWLAGRGRATKDAIDRVESNARDWHGATERRVSVLETKALHAIGKSELLDALAPLYEIVRANEKHAAEIASQVRTLSEEQRDFRNLIIERGINR